MTHSRRNLGDGQRRHLASLDQTEPGINDVHSGAEEIGSDGQAYSTW